MKIRIIDNIYLKIIKDKEGLYNYITKFYSIIHTDFNYGGASINSDGVYLDSSFLINEDELYECLRYKQDMIFIDMKTKEVMVRI